MTAFEYLEPSSVEEVVRILAEDDPGTHLLAGGAALVPLLKTGYVRPTRMVGLRRVDGLREIDATGRGLAIGAMARISEVAESRAVRDGWLLLATACESVGTVRIRNQATIGGNVAHADPSQDPPPALLVLEATAIVRGVHGERRVPAGELFVDYFESGLAPGELLVGFEVPGVPPGARTAYTKFLPRSLDDYAAVSVAALVVDGPDGRLAEVRVALGGVAPRPLRMAGLEERLAGRRPDAAALHDAATSIDDEIDPIDDARGSAAYKRRMAAVWVERTLGDLCGIAVA